MKSNINYLVKAFGNCSRISRNKEVKSLLISSYKRIEQEIKNIQERANAEKEHENFQSLPTSSKQAILKEFDQLIATEKKRLKWFAPFHVAALNETSILSLIADLFKSKEIEYADLFADLYSLAKLHRLVTGVTKYNPEDAHTNVMIVVEMIAEKQCKSFKSGELYTYYNDAKINRGSRRGRDSTLTQTGKIFQLAQKLGMGSYTGAPTSKKIPCVFTVNPDSVLLNWMAKKPSQNDLKCALIALGSKTQ